MERDEFRKLEQKWQNKWSESKCFEPKVDKSKKKFFITTPYPYISGSLHIGQGRAGTETDVIARYKRMQGFNVLYPLAFHISGTPVLGFAAAIKAGDKDKIELYKSYLKNYISSNREIEKVLKSFEEPQSIVNFFVPKMMAEYSSLGFSVDWSRRFTTGDEDYQKFITWQFEKYFKKKYLVKDSYPNLYCTKCENAVGEDDIQDADTNPVKKLEYTILKFSCEELGKNVFLMAATLRPETVYGQTNLWVNPNTEYVKIKVGQEFWMVSSPCKDKLAYQKDDVETIDFVSGQELIGLHCLAPGINRKIIVLPAVFADAAVGTGIVTSVPSDAPYDYIALLDLQKDRHKVESYGLRYDDIKNIKVIPIIKTQKYGEEAAVRIVHDWKIQSQEDPKLEEATQLIYSEGFHQGILNQNCGKYSGLPVEKAKDLMKAELLKNGQADLLYEPSRKAVCRCGGEVIVAMIKNQWFLNFNAAGWKDLAYKCLEKMQIIPELYRKQFKDTFEWLDRRPCARKRGLGTPLPFDKGWMIESLSDSTIYMAFYAIKKLIDEFKIKPEQMTEEFFDYIFNGKDSKNSDVTKKEKGKAGEELPKDKASELLPKAQLDKLREEFDYWYPVDLRHTYPAHLSNHLSFFIFAHAGLFAEKYWPKAISFHGMVLSSGEKMSKSKGNVITLIDVRNKYFADLFRAYMISATTLDGDFDWTEQDASAIEKKLAGIFSVIEEAAKKIGGKVNGTNWFISRFENSIKEATENFDNFNLRDYAQIALFRIPSDYNKFARRCSSESELNAVNSHVLERWIKLLAPLVPHMAEELWSKLGKKTFVSLETWPAPDFSKIDEKVEKQEATFEKIMDDIRQILKITKKTPSKICIYTVPPELKYFESAEAFLSKEFDAKVSVYAVNDKNKYDPENKASKAKLGKPGIYVE